jgi:hypothetical protein
MAYREPGQRAGDPRSDAEIDALVDTLRHADAEVRAAAARALVRLIATDRERLRLRAARMPARVDPMIWPLEAWFPGALAIPIAEALVDEKAVGHAAIEGAIAALRARREEDPDLRALVVQWQRVPRDAQIHRWRRSVGAPLVALGLGLAALFGGAVALVAIVLFCGGDALAVDLVSGRAYSFKAATIEDVRTEAWRAVALITEGKDLEIFLRNRSEYCCQCRPETCTKVDYLPSGSRDTLRSLLRLASSPDPYHPALRQDGLLSDPYKDPLGEAGVFRFSDYKEVPAELSSLLGDDAPLLRWLGALPEYRRLAKRPHVIVSVSKAGAGSCWILGLLLLAAVMQAVRRRRSPQALVGWAAVAYVSSAAIFASALVGAWILWWPIGASGIVLLIGAIALGLPWPENLFLATLDDLGGGNSTPRRAEGR